MKKVIIAIIALLVVAAGVVVFMMLGKDKTTIITMDINPSFKVTLKGDKVSDIVSLNEDAKNIVKENLKNKSFKDSLDLLVNDLIENGIIEGNFVSVVINVDGSKEEKEVEKVIKETFTEHQVSANVIAPVITDTAKELAKKYNITEAKAAYIESVTEQSEVLKVENFVNKSVNEIVSVKETGKYCEEGYTLEGDFCTKVTGEERPIEDKVCKEGYEEINGKCYKNGGFSEVSYCEGNLTLDNNKCTGTKTTDALGKCTTGTYNKTTKKCEVLTYQSEGTKTCREADDLLLGNGKCASHKPGAHSYGDNDDPFDEATECFGADKFHTSPNPDNPGMGWCYNMSGDYDANVTCPSGTTLTTGDKGKGCYKAESSDATYYCEGNAKLDGNKCTGTVSENAKTKKTCSDGYKLYEDRTCVNYSETAEFVSGYKCQSENARLEGNVCKLVEIVDAKSY